MSDFHYKANFKDTQYAKDLGVDPDEPLGYGEASTIAGRIDVEAGRHGLDHITDEVDRNNLRAAWAFAGLDALAQRVYGDPAGEPWENILSDAFCDFMHLCHALGEDPEAIVETATDRYTEELFGEP